MKQWTIIDTSTDEEIGQLSLTESGFAGDTPRVSLLAKAIIGDHPSESLREVDMNLLAIPIDTEDEYAGVQISEDEEPEEILESEADDEPAAASWAVDVFREGVSLGAIKGSDSGSIDLEVTDAALHARLLLQVLPQLEESNVKPSEPGFRVKLTEAIVALDERYSAAVRDDLRESDGAVVRFGSNSPQWGGPAAPWAPVPLSPARDFIKNNPEAALEVNFPTVFEEDRSAKIKDVMTGNVAGYISHRRASEQYAKEMGFEQYDYEEEQQEIATEKPQDAVTPDLQGSKSALGQSIGSTIGGHLGNAGPHGAGLQQGGEEEGPAGLTRAEWATDDTPGQHAFKLDQKRLSENEGKGGKLSASEVLYMEDGGPKRCDRCVFWMPSERCALLGKSQVVKADQVCGLYVNGKPMTAESAVFYSALPASEVGLGPGNTSCGNCRYGRGAVCQNPELEQFPIDNRGGCCNAWDGQETSGN